MGINLPVMLDVEELLDAPVELERLDGTV